MKLDIYQVDAFAAKPFEGNPAAVCPMQDWPTDQEMQNIARENNLSETAFFVKTGDSYHLRWFTPKIEVDLCGHATLASAHVLYNHLGYSDKEIVFDSNSGPLRVRKEDSRLVMNFPATIGEEIEAPLELLKALGVESKTVFKAEDYMVVLDSKNKVEEMSPDFFQLKKIKTRGVIATAPGDETDFVSRFFAPAAGINEDPVTGSAHTMMIPYWSHRLGKKELKARQISERGGDVYCSMQGDRVEIAGEARTYMVGTIEI